jgi:hypothetical protein
VKPRRYGGCDDGDAHDGDMRRFSKLASLLKNSPGARFEVKSGTKHARFGAFRTLFEDAVGSVPTFSTGCCVFTNWNFLSSRSGSEARRREGRDLDARQIRLYPRTV